MEYIDIGKEKPPEGEEVILVYLSCSFGLPGGYSEIIPVWTRGIGYMLSEDADGYGSIYFFETQDGEPLEERVYYWASLGDLPPLPTEGLNE